MIEDLDVFFNEFATTATLEDATEIEIIFDRSSDPMALGTEGRELMATCKSEDVTNVNHGSQIIIEFVNYTIIGINPEMDGKITELILKE